MNEHRRKLQSLLRELFQFDSTDLDFGIYKVMNHKRDRIEKFIEEELLDAIHEGLKTLTEAQQAEATREYQALRKELIEATSEEAVDAKGNLSPTIENSNFRAIREAVAHYKTAKNRYESAALSSDLEAQTYNDLYRFFSRYYDDGDFISQRRYGTGDKYAIPYNGQEVHLHWANFDQYYVKTGEYFTDYRFRLPAGVGFDPAIVQFKLIEASVEQNNVKGEKRMFFMAESEPVSWEPNGRVLTVRFEYRPATATEKERVGKQNQQSKLNEEAAGVVFATVADAVLKSQLCEASPQNPERTQLSRHLKRYTDINSRDFFVHKNLQGFLRQELDFFLKNEIVRLEDIDWDQQSQFSMVTARSKTIRGIADKVISFLAEIENFQKRLWEKRKFVVDTFYCITIGHIPESFYDEIAACDAQWAEWKMLFHIDEALTKKGSTTGRVGYLHTRPTLVLDTRHFDLDFTSRLLCVYDNLDDITDGLLVNSENWQALNLLQARYQAQVDFVYIDPPYNTAATPILYKNDYRESSWLSLLENRLRLAAKLQDLEAATCVAIDDTELDKISLLLRVVYANHDLFRVVVNHYPGSGTGRSNMTRTHEYALFMVPVDVDLLRGEMVDAGERERNFRRSGTGENNYRTGRPNSFYAILVDPKTRDIVGVEPPPTGMAYPRDATENGCVRIYPIGEDGSERVWSLSYETAESAIANCLLRCTENMVVNRLYSDKERRNLLPSLWTGKRFSAVSYGTNLLTDMFNINDSFSYPKSLYTVDYAIDAATYAKRRAIVLDYFAGSGTTGHATIFRNRSDRGQRRFVLVEMADYFDTVLLPRIKKVTFTPEWKDGKPKRLATAEEAERSPRLVKVVRLESYEDTLNNIRLRHIGDDLLSRLEAMPDYFLRYMLDYETEGSPSLLDIKQFTRPFDYKLDITRHNVTQSQSVDLVTTFNFLLGLRVRTIRRFERDGSPLVRITGEDADGKRICVLWRNVPDPGDMETEKKWILDHALSGIEYDQLYVNGESALPNTTIIESEFKRLMFEGVN